MEDNYPTDFNDQSISKMMDANCEAGFRHALFVFTIKARYLYLMINFIRRLLCREKHGFEFMQGKLSRHSVSDFRWL
jgi:hypothetical protein